MEHRHPDGGHADLQLGQSHDLPGFPAELLLLMGRAVLVEHADLRHQVEGEGRARSGPAQVVLAVEDPAAVIGQLVQPAQTTADPAW